MSLQKILTIGDSFTYGYELDNLDNAWPYVLARQLQSNVVNKGANSSGNIKMVRSLIEETISDYDLVIIAWSGFDRIELADEYGIWETWPGARSENHNNYRIQNHTEFRKILIDYVNCYHNDNYLYRQQYLSQVILAQNYLKYHKKNYIMLDTIINHKFPGRLSDANKDLINQIDTDFFLGWPSESMEEWTKDVPLGPGKHFLEQGHKIVASKVYDFLKSLKYV